MKRKTIVTAASLVMVGGLWWQFQGPPSAMNAETVASATAATQNQTDTTELEDYFDQDDPTNPTTNEVSVEQKNLATDEELNTCVPVENGFGIEMKDWGKVRLPYANGWPKNEPGTPIDCAPNTDFGAAVVAAHGLYLQSISPELIPEIAMDTPGRQKRIDAAGADVGADVSADEFPVACTAVGWDRPQPGIYIWLIYTQCDGQPMQVTSVRMQNDTGNQWLMVYNPNGTTPAVDVEPGIEYFPFEGGD